ncbi:MAG TPA: hypothetical protein PLP29_10425 [Candidatus Ozemobacteraceae bacterium]|nr:hypothetical protein [Candidatus Ozemobacteraceae bacterium]
MPLAKRDKEFRLTKISFLDFKFLEPDRVMTSLFMRLAHQGYASRLKKRTEKTIDDFVNEFCENTAKFSGFGAHRDIVTRWVETDLLDIVNRGRPNQAIAAPRPLHGFTYRFRNPRHSRAYGADQHLYEMLRHARPKYGQGCIDHLKAFCFEGYDPVTGRPLPNQVLDVETQALLHLSEQVDDAPDTSGDHDTHPPVCIGGADLLADDIKRLLFYQRFIPRSVMIEYLKILLFFHLGLNHLRLLKMLPAMVRSQGAAPMCEKTSCPMNPRDFAAPHGACPFRIGLFVDVAGIPATGVLGERSADAQYRRIPPFIKAYFTARKLDEFATDLLKRQKAAPPVSGGFGIRDVLHFLDASFRGEQEKFFGQRVSALTQGSGEDEEGLDPELKAVAEMGLSDLETYIEMLVAVRGNFHRQYLTECLDSLLMKNRPGALVVQGKAKSAPRRFSLDSRLLEVLLQIAVLQPGGAAGYHTGELRIDELTAYLRERYGIYIDRFPRGDGFDVPSLADRKALRENQRAFVSRLREIGFYRDLSDASISQTVTPRYRIDE